MADNPSSFVSFGDYLGLAGDEVQRLEDEALARADAQAGTAQEALARAGQEAQRGAGVELSQTASYSEYLAAKQKAKEAYVAASRPTGNAFEDAARGAVGQDAQAYAAAGLAKLGAGEEAWAGRANTWSDSYRQSQQQYKEWQSQQQAAKDAQRAAYDKKAQEMGGHPFGDSSAAAEYSSWADAVNSDAAQGGGIGAGAAYDWKWRK